MLNHWLRVVYGAIFEVGWVVGFKHATTLWEWGLTALAVYLSFYFLIKAGEVLPAGTAYAVFVGLGTLGTTIVGILAFGEPVSVTKLALIGLLLIGIGGLQTVTTKEVH
ncbi:DMT family transporter [Levilactobacillus tujiorum]|uniref:QacE family quaternary ammonium compound efflux SMR transporter n=1 Tax=Levilactobacillus tujiorum TaxID=2912243 RepID=A0ABX1L4X8_9LACO|nr:SMR family transporter [Levilactobacillus tujiorum]MCH5464354.1 SMR family transporter [Levilactobacillus tujiorum]NLR11373.1 QacE family quaternary ammonium compound efflux SMR transporter [Lactobacillus sp. HBUAS51387]NLR29333.1 QacE family quaternary ammonium compound efflux SMR transporter [Levilactobacillus tujiorum]